MTNILNNINILAFKMNAFYSLLPKGDQYAYSANEYGVKYDTLSFLDFPEKKRKFKWF